jgi:hypothetical protein
MFLSVPLHHPRATARPVREVNMALPHAPVKQTLMYNALSFKDDNQPHLMCPHCGQERIRVPQLPYFTCAGKHCFYACPQCLDTRVSMKQQDTVYCAFHHAYHLCPVHRTAVLGVAPSDNFDRLCTCAMGRSISILSESYQGQQFWDMPFY